MRIGIYSSASRPWKIGIVSPSRTCTTAFFHSRVRPAVYPRRLGLDGTDEVRTSTTPTSNSSSIACLICVLCASGWTRNVYLPIVASAYDFSETIGLDDHLAGVHQAATSFFFARAVTASSAS